MLKCTGPIPATGPATSPLMLILEAPGKDELRMWSAGNSYLGGCVAVGQAGQEMDNYLHMVQLARAQCYVTNIVKCRPPGNRDPHVAEITACTPALVAELAQVQPLVIGALGKFATAHFLGSGEFSLEALHGVPLRVPGLDPILVPMYHPALGLHDHRRMAEIREDFQALADVLRGAITPHVWGAIDSPVDYQVFKPELHSRYLSSPIAIDTETTEHDLPWSAQFSCTPDTGFFIHADDNQAIRLLAAHVVSPHVETVLHNAMFDLPVLADLGIRPYQVLDTMVMAYLLQTEPQGLKSLALRHCNLRMQSYSEMVASATTDKALAYLESALRSTWPEPEEYIVYDKGIPKIKRSWPIPRKIRNILNDYALKGADLWDRWYNIDLPDGRALVETKLGPMPPGYLSDIPFPAAMAYACQDADATLRIFPILWERIKSSGLTDTFWRDMSILPMVCRMERTGMLVSRPRMQELRTHFEARKAEIEDQILQLTGTTTNPGSWQQVVALFKGLDLKDSRDRPITSTGRDVLLGIIDTHPVIQLIIDWRKYRDLIVKFVGSLLTKTDTNDRVHPTIRVTRTVTGRLAMSNPNLMNQPVRTEEGRMVRSGFVARKGCVLLSGDYSQIEMRITAHCSQDPTMLKVFHDNKDIHTQTAMGMFRITDSNLIDADLHRYPAKRVGFGIIMQISPHGLLREMTTAGTKWDLPGCEDLIRRWFAVYPGVKSWIEADKAHARRFGYVQDLWGKRMFTVGTQSCLRRVREDDNRKAAACPIQMGAQGIIKQAMGELVPLYESFLADNYIFEPLIQIHDDLVWEIQEDIIDDVVPLIKYVMEGVKVPVWDGGHPHGTRTDELAPITTGLGVDFKIGQDWGNMEKLKL